MMSIEKKIELCEIYKSINDTHLYILLYIDGKWKLKYGLYVRNSVEENINKYDNNIYIIAALHSNYVLRNSLISNNLEKRYLRLKGVNSVETECNIFMDVTPYEIELDNASNIMDLI